MQHWKIPSVVADQANRLFRERPGVGADFCFQFAYPTTANARGSGSPNTGGTCSPHAGTFRRRGNVNAKVPLRAPSFYSDQSQLR